MSVSRLPIEPNRSIALAYVVVQAVILLLLIVPPVGHAPNLGIAGLLGTVFEVVGLTGILVSAYSIRRSLTAMPLPKENGTLATTGLYRFVRHPMYTSVIIFALGLAIGSGQLSSGFLVVALIALFYYKSRYEEVYLARKYRGYTDYAKTTPRLIPQFRYRSRSS